MDFELTPKLLAQSRVVAKGNRIRDVQRLVMTYGGKTASWVKKSTPMIELEQEIIEYHWYEHPRIGRVEVKRKVIQQR